MSRTEIAINPDVLKWAITESGYTIADVAEVIDGDERKIVSWLDAEAQPSLGEMKAVAQKLHRQLATFLLPKVPAKDSTPVKFRHPLGAESRALNPKERRFLRRATRYQDAYAWLISELGRETPSLPTYGIRDDSVSAAVQIRAMLKISVTTQRGWPSASRAFDAWRESVESLGVMVFLFAMGKESVRGFSLWHDRAPVIAINTAWSDEARIFSLFHELGHLLTRSNSACAASPLATGDPKDKTERWCETFAAALLLPARALDEIGHVSDLVSLRNLARKFKVSLSAMALQLIHLGKAKWTLLRVIPLSADTKKGGGPPGSARNLRQQREDELGKRGAGVFVDAVKKDIIATSEALDYLDIPRDHFDALMADFAATR